VRQDEQICKTQFPVLFLKKNYPQVFVVC
jgi:hypothetical protein